MKALCLLLLAVVAPRPAAAQIATDGSAGAAQVLKGPAYVVPEALGKLTGANLFHSFSQFNLSSGESATFVLGTPGIAHVISRVTGGAPSFIDGLLRLDASGSGGTPAFWLINPRGVLLGENALLDLPGAFHLSTAPQLRMADGSRWEAEGGSSFSAAAPEAFGFLGAAAPVLVQGATLNAPSLQIAAGDVSITGATLVGRGGVRIAASGDWRGDVPVAGALPGGLGGFVGIGEGSLIGVVTAGAADGGALQLSAGSLLLNGGAGLVTQANVGSSGRGGDIDLQLTQDFQASGGGFVQSTMGGSGTGGALRLKAARAQLSGDAFFWTLTEGTGAAGDIRLDLRESAWLDSGANLYTSVFPGASGAGGRIELSAPVIELQPGSFVQSVTYGDGTGGALRLVAGQALRMVGASVISDATGSAAAGEISLSSGGALSLLGDSDITASSTQSPIGAAITLNAQDIRIGEASRVTQFADAGAQLGDVLLRASRSLQLDSGASIDGNALAGSRAGSIRLEAPSLLVSGGAEVRNNAMGIDAISGDIALVASGRLEMNGGFLNTIGLEGANSGNLSLQAADMLIDGASSLITLVSDGSARAGSISLSASASLRISGASELVTSTFSNGNAGAVRMSARDIRIDGQSEVRSAAGDGSGNAGAIVISASNQLVLTEQASLRSSTVTPGRGGDMSLSGRQVLIEQGATVGSVSDSGGGEAGNIDINATEQLLLGKGTGVDSSTARSSGNAGAITLKAGNLLAMDGAYASSSSLEGSGRAGNLLLESGGQISLTGASGLNSFSSGAGAGGDVRLSARRIDIGGASTVDTSSTGTGAGGSIRMSAGELRIHSGSRMLASAFPGSSGQVGDIDLSATASIQLQDAGLAVENGATVTSPASLRLGLLRLQAPRIALEASTISSASFANADAGSIELRAGEQLLAQESLVSTLARDGNGGPLTVESGSLIRLRGSQLVTSVLGTRGNGGDVSVKAPVLLLDNGFIQANTAASGASGGDINLAVDALLASGNRLAVGGDTPYVFRLERDYNVIQAAAPDGINGRLNFANPVLDLSGSLVLLQGALFDAGRLARSPCERRGGSLFSVSGQGALPASRWLSPLPPAQPGRDQPGGGCR